VKPGFKGFAALRFSVSDYAKVAFSWVPLLMWIMPARRRRNALAVNDLPASRGVDSPIRFGVDKAEPIDASI
jgi:hypothetical protein